MNAIAPSIHHTIAKRAVKLGVILEDLGADENPSERFKAHWPKLNQVIFGGTAKAVLDNMATLIMIKEQFRSFKVDDTEDGFTITVKGIKDSLHGPNSSLQYVFDHAKAAWLAAQAAKDEDGDEEVEDEAIDEDSDDRSGSIVKQKYRARYAEAGHPATCGDWLANLLNERTTNKGGFNLELFAEICVLNGVDMTAYSAITKPSDRGRFKMTGRNMIAKKVFDRGYVVLPDGQFNAPQDWLDAQRFVKSKGKPPIRTPEMKG